MLKALLEEKRRAYGAKEQQERRELTGHKLARHPAVANYNYGIARENFAHKQFLSCPPEQVKGNFAVLAEALAMQGRFSQAAEQLDDGPLKKLYEAKAVAMAQVGTKCSCPDSKLVSQPGNAIGKTVPSFEKFDEVYNGKMTVSFARCTLCGGIFAYQS